MTNPTLTGPSLTIAREALKLLIENGSHAGYDRETANRITVPFGFEARMHVEVANDPKNPKGLWIEGMKPRTKVERVGGWTLAAQICQHLGLPAGNALGRGSAFRQSVAAINGYLNYDPEGT